MGLQFCARAYEAVAVRHSAVIVLGTSPPDVSMVFERAVRPKLTTMPPKMAWPTGMDSTARTIAADMFVMGLRTARASGFGATERGRIERRQGGPRG